MIAHTGDPAYYTPGYNELIQDIIHIFSPLCQITIKAHPLSNSLPQFNGKYEVMYKVINEEEIAGYDIFVNEDSYMGVEMFFRGKQVFNFGVIDSEASNIDFTHFWSDDSQRIIEAMGTTIQDWEEVNGKHIQYLNHFFSNYVPPKEFGTVCLRSSETNKS